MTPGVRRAAAPTRSSATERAVPGDALLHPVALAAIGLLLVNDHLLKAAWPGWWTGKLSDFAGLIFFPLLLQATWEVVAAQRGTFRASGTALLVAVGASAVAFSAIELWPAAADLAAFVGGLAQWPARAFLATVAGTPLPGVAPVAFTADVTDLLALPALALSLAIGMGRSAGSARYGSAAPLH